MIQLAILWTVLLVGLTNAIPSSTRSAAVLAAGCDAPVKLNSSENIWKEYKLHPNIIYRNTVTNAAENITDPSMKARALRVANTGTFTWMQVTIYLNKSIAKGLVVRKETKSRKSTKSSRTFRARTFSGWSSQACPTRHAFQSVCLPQKIHGIMSRSFSIPSS